MPAQRRRRRRRGRRRHCATSPERRRLNGAPLPDGAAQSPLSQGLAGLGRNLGTVAPGATVTITYAARAARAVRAGAVRPRARVSTRENLVPAPANAAAGADARAAAAQDRRDPGRGRGRRPGVRRPAARVVTVARRGSVRRPVRVFAFDRRYRDHYPSIRVVAGRSAPAPRCSAPRPRARSRSRPAGGRSCASRAGRELALPSAAWPISRGPGRSSPAVAHARSRSSSTCRTSIVVSPRCSRAVVDPGAARRERRARRRGQEPAAPRRSTCSSTRTRLHSAPAAALAQTLAVARSIQRIAPGQDYLIDNVSNTLMVASADAAVGKRMFFFLGLPGVLLAALLAAYAGGVLAATQRREQAILRLRGAHRGHLMRDPRLPDARRCGCGVRAGRDRRRFLCALAILGSGGSAGRARRPRAPRR